ncbi:MAG: hypothetical protein LBQ40_06315 [Clostridiales bacterium]|jgi:DNA segregation ATPase FtsK/SpoIIIE-like protein|nr:hypothetical protein [Clostridiales bacterium]
MNKIIGGKGRANFSAALITAFLASALVFVCLLGVLPGGFAAVKDFFLGTLGIAAYAYCVFLMLSSAALIFGLKILVRKITVVKFALCFLFFVAMMHTITAAPMFEGGAPGFGAYVNAVFENADTAGGLPFGLLTYHLQELLGTISAIAALAAVVLGIILWIAAPYLRVSRQRQRSETPSLTEINNGAVDKRPVGLPPKSEGVRRPIPPGPRPSVREPSVRSYAKPEYAPPIEEAKQRAFAKLYENGDTTILVDKSAPSADDVFAVKKKNEPEPFVAAVDDISDYTNNGRRKRLLENTGQYQNGFAASAQSADGEYRRDEPQSDAPQRDFVYPTSDEGFYIKRRAEKDGETQNNEPPSAFSGDMDALGEYYKQEAARAKSIKEHIDRERREREEADKAEGLKSVKRPLGFVDDGIDDGRQFVNSKKKLLQKTDELLKKLYFEESKDDGQPPQNVQPPKPQRPLQSDGFAPPINQESLSEFTDGGVDADGLAEPKEAYDSDDIKSAIEERNKKIKENIDDGAQEADGQTGQNKNFGAFVENASVNPPQRLFDFNPLKSRPFKIEGFEKPQRKPKDPLDGQMTMDDLKPIVRKPYAPPPINLLLEYDNKNSSDVEELKTNASTLEGFFNEFKVSATSTGVVVGPTFTRYEFQMPPGISVNKVGPLEQDISMRLMTPHKIRIEAPIPGKNAFGIEIPNKKRSIVGMRDLVNDDLFYDEDGKLTFTVGKDISGENYYGDIADMPHLLVAGSTGSGKSICLNSLIISLLYKYSPDEVRLILIDPKQVEFAMFEGLPHLLLPDIITQNDKVISALDWAIKEMHRRYGVIKESRSSNINEYNKKVGKNERMYRIVIVVDEVAEVMLAMKREVEDRIRSLSQLARAAGIHVILATQRPSVDIITGVIKSNMPSRIAFAVTSNVDSRTIIDKNGAERLLGKGDMLYQTQAMQGPVRIQGVFISNQEVTRVVEYVKANNIAYYDAAINDEINAVKEPPKKSGDEDAGDGPALDPLFVRAVLHVVENESASISMLQRKFSIGYSRAARIIDNMEERKIIGKGDGAKPRNVLITKAEFQEIFAEFLKDDDDDDE